MLFFRLKKDLRVSDSGEYHFSCVIRKPAFCICENKDADHLHGTYSTILNYFLHPKFQASSHLLLVCRVVSDDQVTKPLNRFFS